MNSLSLLITVSSMGFNLNLTKLNYTVNSSLINGFFNLVSQTKVESLRITSLFQFC